MHLPSLVTWGTTAGGCCQNQDKRKMSVKLWTGPSSWEQVTYSNHSTLTPQYPSIQGPWSPLYGWTKRETVPSTPSLNLLLHFLSSA